MYLLYSFDDLGLREMQKNHIQTDELNTVSDCLAQLIVAEKTQIDIEQQLARPNYNKEWKKRAELALKTVKYKRRVITARLSVLRHEEKAYNVQIHQRRNDYLIFELKKIVTPSSFERCVQRATERLERERGIDAQVI